MFSGEKEHKMAMCKAMLEKMKAGEDPMAMGREMVDKKKGKCC